MVPPEQTFAGVHVARFSGVGDTFCDCICSAFRCAQRIVMVPICRDNIDAGCFRLFAVPEKPLIQQKAPVKTGAFLWGLESIVAAPAAAEIATTRIACEVIA